MIDVDQGEIVLEALRNRRSTPALESRRPPRELIERVLAAGVWGPNHHKTEPWRFVVISGEARERLGEVMAGALWARLPQPDSEHAAALLAKERKKPLRAPVVIVAAVIPCQEPKVVEIEEVEAGAAAVQNLLTAAQALGLGAMWRTGEAAYDPAIKRFLGLPEQAHIIAFVYLGYPDMPELPPRERDAERYTTWLGWDEPGP